MKREPTKPNIVNEVHRERLCYLGIFFYGGKLVELFLSTTGIALGNPLIASKMKFVSLLKLFWPQFIELTQYLFLC